LDAAEKVSAELLLQIGKYFVKYEVCGSIRRRRRDVGDVDIVAIPKPDVVANLSEFIKNIDKSGESEAKTLGKSGASRFLNGKSIKRFRYKGITVDLYLANEDTFGTLVLIRTGPKEHNIKLTRLTRSKGFKLFASGKGLCQVDDSDRILKTISNKENEILEVLLGRVPPPNERDE
jgi:DNA polymerase/3'-5' exonuclease PolX